MTTVKVYKIYNADDDTNFYIGSTRQKYVSARWGYHRCMCKKGVISKLYNHMREKGIDKFTCVEIYTKVVDDVKAQRVIEQKFIDELKPTLNGGLDQDKVFNELMEYNNEYENKLKQYQKEYHKTYSPEYYVKNRKAINTQCKRYYTRNKMRISDAKKIKNDIIRASKIHNCPICDISLTSASALKKHKLSKAHLMKI